MDKSYQYPGEELTLFQHATNWKTYLKKHIDPYIKGHVLEVGAGIGGTTKLLNNGSYSSWSMLEPDDQMYRELLVQALEFKHQTIVLKGTLGAVEGRKYDTIIYIDVLEHIEKDHEEIEMATKILKDGGHLIVLSPAFQFLYSPFDRAIGHYRRYHKRDIIKLAPESLKPVQLQYLDSFGFIASVMNKLFLHQSYPTKKQVSFWDKTLVQISKVTDPLFFYSFGKSILAVWEKKSA
jgi:hypothetical protein